MNSASIKRKSRQGKLGFYNDYNLPPSPDRLLRDAPDSNDEIETIILDDFSSAQEGDISYSEAAYEPFGLPDDVGSGEVAVSGGSNYGSVEESYDVSDSLSDDSFDSGSEPSSTGPIESYDSGSEVTVDTSSTLSEEVITESISETGVTEEVVSENLVASEIVEEIVDEVVDEVVDEAIAEEVVSEEVLAESNYSDGSDTSSSEVTEPEYEAPLNPEPVALTASVA